MFGKITVTLAALFFLTPTGSVQARSLSEKNSNLTAASPQNFNVPAMIESSLEEFSTTRLKKAQASPAQKKTSSPRVGGKVPRISRKNEAPVAKRLRDKGYTTLGPRDLIEISVWENENLTMEAPIRPDGLISFPLIGDIQAEGLTPDELRKKIAVDLKDFFKNPNVSVILKEINSDTIRVSVGGEVDGPGSYEVQNSATLLHAVSIARGHKETADLKRAYLLRQGEIVGVDFFALMENSDLSQNVPLKNNDLIYFPNNLKKRVNIIGEVNKPQVIRFQEGMTLLDAVLLAGGPTPTAKPGSTRIYRQVIHGSGKKVINKLEVELDKVIFEGDLSQNLPLKPGDIILIPRSFF